MQILVKVKDMREVAELITDKADEDSTDLRYLLPVLRSVIERVELTGAALDVSVRVEPDTNEDDEA